ncbi:MAG: glucose-6-phosphate dehydrogenase [Candidatus Latescibacter sp.]|nr:glucose-6-phosphate dehydrogenase [Candidatus Latescibacter sp.]
MAPVNTTAMPVTIVIFGATGDLTRRKLIPSLFSLYRKGRLPSGLRIAGYARRPYSNEIFRNYLLEGVQEYVRGSFDPAAWQAFSQNIVYVRGDLSNTEDYPGLQLSLGEIEGGPANRVYYLASSPEYFPIVVKNLGESRMAGEEEGWRRIVIEKPFGRDLPSAVELNRIILSVFQESQVYRIDHYLGKETAQNILFFRFGNTIFEPIWNRNYIDHVQITMAESVDVGHRAGYYDQAGIIRDIFQNHMMQLLALVAMEPSSSFEADAIRNEKSKVLTALRPIAADEVAKYALRGQYRGYRGTEKVAPDSQIPTYAVLQIYIDNWRWQGIPFFLRCGKALTAKTTEINIQFRRPPHVLFPLPPGRDIKPNLLTIGIQPDEGAHLRFEVKNPDTTAEMHSVEMSFHYADVFGPDSIPESYERLLLDILVGDASLFARKDAIETAWRFIDPIIKGLDGQAAPPLYIYEPGSRGPAEADEFIARAGYAWLHRCGGHDSTCEREEYSWKKPHQ